MVREVKKLSGLLWKWNATQVEVVVRPMTESASDCESTHEHYLTLAMNGDKQGHEEGREAMCKAGSLVLPCSVAWIHFTKITIRFREKNRGILGFTMKLVTLKNTFNLNFHCRIFFFPLSLTDLIRECQRNVGWSCAIFWSKQRSPAQRDSYC